jgi:hypothetical protein
MSNGPVALFLTEAIVKMREAAPPLFPAPRFLITRLSVRLPCPCGCGNPLTVWVRVVASLN